MTLQKVTTNYAPSRRRYDDACGTAHGLDLIGERWALLVMRELMLGAKRFSDLRADLPGISANVLTQRLEGLEAAGLLVRRKLPPPAAAQVYELTEWGYEAEPIIQALGRWATRSPDHDPSLPLSATSIILSFRTMIDLEKAKDLDARIGFRIGAETFLGTFVDGDFAIARGPVEGTDLVFIGSAPALAAAVYGGQDLDELAKAGVLTIAGDRALAARFTTLFPLPAKAPRTPPEATH